MATCAAIWVARTVSPPPSTQAALVEAQFLGELAPESPSGDGDFLDARVGALLDSVVPAETRALLAAPSIRVEWEEPAALRQLKSRTLGANPKELPASDDFWDFYSGVQDLKGRFDSVRFSPAPSYIGNWCAQASHGLTPYVAMHPLEGLDGEGRSTLDARAIWRDAQDRSVSDLFYAWEQLEEVFVWLPSGAPEGSSLIYHHIAARLALPARLAADTSAANVENCHEMAFELTGLDFARPPSFKRGSATTRLPRDGETYGQVVLRGEPQHTYGASEGSAVVDWWGYDIKNNLVDPPLRIEVRYPAMLRVVDGQQAILSANRKVKRPPGFERGVAAVSFPALSAFISNRAAKDSALHVEGDPLRVVVARLKDLAESEARSVPLLGFSIPTSKLGGAGLLFVLVLYCYFAIHLRQLAIESGRGSSTAESWIALHETRLAHWVFVASVTVLPALTCASLLKALASASGDLDARFAVVVVGTASMLIGAGYWCVRDTHLLRVWSRRSLAQPHPSPHRGLFE